METSRWLPQRIYLDASFTLASGKSSGVERVVRNLLHESHALGSRGNWPVPQTVLCHRGSFHVVDQQALGRLQRTAVLQGDIVSHLPPAYRAVVGALCRTVPVPTLRKWLHPEPGRMGIFRAWHNGRQAADFRWIAKRCRQVSLGPADLLILPDAYWIRRLRGSVWQAAQRARANGATVVGLVYDLIPLTHPQFVGDRASAAFRQYVLGALAHTDHLICISRTVCDQLREFAKQAMADLKTLPTISHFQLGAELKLHDGIVRPHIQSIMQASPAAYLKVATLDPRKNHAYVLDAFEQLWRTHPHARLVLVGRIGASCHDLVQRIRQHARYNEQLFLLNDLSDAEVQYCYRHCRAVIFASIVEGFGLPIVEALWHGKPMLASDITIHREVGGDACAYFNLADPADLADQLRRLEAGSGRASAPPVPPPAACPIDWSESCRQFFESALQAYRDKNCRQTVPQAA
ncbi:MAG: hypothetical protein KatS3mg111_3422 [Pirellulaceae bacterium]|nr:MAG: hypothetical protein KatS3mg111_3422 [Pirellulaceae bacterium]